MYHAEARFYDAKYRQFMSADPIKDGYNWYAYAEANPVTFTDPTGLESYENYKKWERELRDAGIIQQGDMPVEEYVNKFMNDAWTAFLSFAQANDERFRRIFGEGHSIGDRAIYVVNFILLGIPDGAQMRYEVYVANPNWNTGLSYWTFGISDVIEGALFPEEMFSFSHIASMTTVIYGASGIYNYFQKPGCTISVDIPDSFSGISGTKGDIVFGSDVKSLQKLISQMKQRGWTSDLIRNTIEDPYVTRSCTNRATGNLATAYYTPKGSYVIVDNVTNAIVQISDNINPSSWIPDTSIIHPYIP